MTDRLTYNIMTVLLKSVYRQNLISEDTYNHSLHNLSKTADCRRSPACDAAADGVGPSGRVSD